MYHTPTSSATPSSVPISLTITGLTDIGRVRGRNEDSLALDPVLGLAVVADGMGGHPGGHVASRLAATAALESLAQHAREGSDEPLREAMDRTVRAAHERIRQEGEARPELVGMGTTLTAMAVSPETGAFAIGHVGDSRAYVLDSEGIRQLTRDHTWVQERVEAKQLTPEQARTHPFGHMLSQCLGMDDPPEVDVLEGRVAPGECYLLCTDGLVGMLEDHELGAIVREAAGPEEAAEALIAAANERGGYDNITLAFVAVG